MTLGLVFWIIMLVLLVFGFLGARPPEGQPWKWGSFGMSLVVFVLFFLLGWQVFGPMLRK